jgi:hypothetical protein
MASEYEDLMIREGRNAYQTITFRPLGALLLNHLEFGSINSFVKYLQKLGDEGGYSIMKLDQSLPVSRLAAAGRIYPNFILYGYTKARKSRRYASTVDKSKQRETTGSKKTNCPFKIKAIRVEDEEPH